MCAEICRQCRGKLEREISEAPVAAEGTAASAASVTADSGLCEKSHDGNGQTMASAASGLCEKPQEGNITDVRLTCYLYAQFNKYYSRYLSTSTISYPRNRARYRCGDVAIMRRFGDKYRHNIKMPISEKENMCCVSIELRKRSEGLGDREKLGKHETTGECLRSFFKFPRFSLLRN